MSEINSDNDDGSTASMQMSCLTLSSPKDVKHARMQDEEAVIDEHIKYHSKMILDLSKSQAKGLNKVQSAVQTRF